MSFACSLAVIIIVALYFLVPAENVIIPFPNGKEFAFSIFDDTDLATVENVKPVYDLLYKLGIVTTKSIWPMPTEESDWIPNQGQTLADADYRNFILDIQNKGFEIGFHGSRGGSSTRTGVEAGIKRFEDIVGHIPYIYANHSENHENLYWGEHRLDVFLIKYLYRLYTKKSEDYFSGHKVNSIYFWGDIAKEKITYVRNFTFNDINTIKMNRSMPYHDGKKPYVNYWFSSSDGNDVTKFNQLLSKKNLDKLQKEHGVCIVYTHFAYGFVKNGVLNSETEERLRDLASRNGYFVPVTELLDYIHQHRRVESNISFREKLRMQIIFLLEKIFN